MTNNDILRRLRFIFDLNDSTMISIFGLGGKAVVRSDLNSWLKPEHDDLLRPLLDIDFDMFLNGFITFNRGSRDDVTLVPSKRIDNNLILKKLKNALNLKDVDIVDILSLADFRFSKHEVNALFRSPSSDKYRVCKNQVLRNFLVGLQNKYRPDYKIET